MQFIDKILNRIAMYRAVLYGLIVIWLGSLVMSLFGLEQFSALDLVLSTSFILAVCYFTNYIFAWVYKAPSNYDSVYITAFILSLIISPNNPFGNLWFLGWASVLAMASKYILAINKKHIFNPAAIAVVITALFINQSASWWVANLYTAPFVFIAGYLIARKIQRFDLVISFIITSLACIIFWSISQGQNWLLMAGRSLVYSPIIFFGSIMLTEPLTTPPTKKLRIIYGFVTGFLFAPFIHIGSFYGTPELALVMGNIYSYVVSPKIKLILKLTGRRKAAANTYSFFFQTDQKFNFKPGQYLEWTVPHDYADALGIRRYFTIAGATAPGEIEIGVRFPNKPSSFKRRLLSLNLGDTIVASQLSGDFVLPENKNNRLVFIAGGIGITPFKSMIQSMIDNGDKRDVTLFYSNRKPEDIAYYNLFNEMERDFKKEINLKIIYALTDLESVPENWTGLKGRIDAEAIIRSVQNYKDCLYYLSGPTSVVSSFKKLLLNIGVSKRQIRTDYFPGFA